MLRAKLTESNENIAYNMTLPLVGEKNAGLNRDILYIVRADQVEGLGAEV